VLLSPATILFISNITVSFLPLSLRLLSTGDQVPNKYPTICKYLSSCYKNKLQKNTSRTITIILLLILLPLFAVFSPQLNVLGLAIRCNKARQNAVLMNQHLPLYNNVSATITATRCLCRLNTLFSATTSALHLFLVNNSFYFSLPLYPFFVSKTENKKGSRDRACCNEVLVNSLPANIYIYISVHLGLLLQRKGRLGLAAAVAAVR